MLIEKTQKVFSKELIARILNNHFSFEEDLEAVEELIRKIEKLNKIRNIDVIVESDLRLANEELNVAEMLWLNYRTAVMLLAASTGCPNGLQLDETKFERPKDLIYNLIEFWVSGTLHKIKDLDLNQFILDTSSNIIWLENELEI